MFLTVKICLAFMTIITLALMLIAINYLYNRYHKKKEPKPFKGIYPKGYPVNKYGIKAEYFEKLIYLKAYEKWESEFEKDIKSWGVSVNLVIEHLNNTVSFHRFISTSFIWPDNKYFYWLKIANS